MTFTQSLYHPLIVPEKDWLINAVLYWDKIHTIVPENEAHWVYERDEVTRRLYEAGILNPIKVSPSMPELKAVDTEVFKYLKDHEISRFVEQGEEAKLFLKKMSSPLLEALVKRGVVKRRGRNQLVTSPGFASYYMTILAGELGLQKGFAPVTSMPSNFDLVNQVRVGTTRSEQTDTNYQRRLPGFGIHSKRSLAESMLVKFALRGVNISSETPIDKLLVFREKYSSELGRFRAEIGSLVDNISFDDDFGLIAFERKLEDTYINNIEPTIKDVNASLKGNGFDVTGRLLTVAATVLVSNVSDPDPINLALGTTVAVTSEIMRYRFSKRQKLRDNPYSFLIQAQQSFGTVSH